jgi:hypothetical protein
VSRDFPPPSASLSAAAEQEIVRWEALWFRTYLLLFIFFDCALVSFSRVMAVGLQQTRKTFQSFNSVLKSSF